MEGEGDQGCGQGGRGQGILLYYHYSDLRRSQLETSVWMQALCKSLGLRGRVRVAEDGVNATLGGAMPQLQQHIAAASDRFGPGIDFKLAANPGARNQQAEAETGFNTLSVKTCKELVTLGHLAYGRANPWTHAGAHLSPQQFHDMLLSAACAGGERSSLGSGPCGQDGMSSAGESGAQGSANGNARQAAAGAGKETVLMDVRNIYETSIGHFDVEGVEFLDPQTRQFSDFPAFVNQQLSKLCNKRILMYCTGGVRCERASAYLREKGEEWADVYQLQGGIQRYLEAFPDGGLFKGKNFVYDERIAVGVLGLEAQKSCPKPNGSSLPCHQGAAHAVGAAPAVVGCCLVCSTPWDDYGRRLRCSLCRQLVLVCDSCSTTSAVASLTCILCAMRKAKGHRSCSTVPHKITNAQQQGKDQQQQQQQQGHRARRLRILCLHGFRQTASNFEGRTHGFRKKLRDHADFVFVNAPHELPLFFKPRIGQEGQGSDTQEEQQQQQGQQHEVQGVDAGICSCMSSFPHPAVRKRAWLVSPEILQHQQQQREQEQQRQHKQQQEQQQEQEHGFSVSSHPKAATRCDEWEPAPDFVSDQQHLQQSEGWQASWEVLQQVVQDQGPFDGLLGFSQGAGIAAALCAVQQRQCQEPRTAVLRYGHHHQQSGQDLQGQQEQEQQPQLGFRFAIMASGYAPASPELQQLLRSTSPLQLPSLHLLGCSDRQVTSQESEVLAGFFDAKNCKYIRHGAAHILPASRSLVSAVQSFLEQQMHPHSL